MSTEQHRITLTENDDGRWTAREDPAGLSARGETPEAALDALSEADDDGTNEDPPAAPLYELVGMLDEDEADRVRERSREFREEFDERVERTRRELSDQN
jgi:hypothetical protein